MGEVWCISISHPFFYIQKGGKIMNQNQSTEISAEELAMIRNKKNEWQRKWWAKMTPEERRQRRLRYMLNTIKKEAAAYDDEG